jgi:hypothetical protein
MLNDFELFDEFLELGLFVFVFSGKSEKLSIKRIGTWFPSVLNFLDLSLSFGYLMSSILELHL